MGCAPGRIDIQDSQSAYVLFHGVLRLNAGYKAALDKLDFMLAIDIYLSETAQHADVVLPAAPVFEKGHFEYYAGSNVTRNVARYSPPIFQSPDGFYSEWEIMLQLTAIIRGGGMVERSDLAALEEEVVRGAIVAAFADPYGVAHGGAARAAHTRDIANSQRRDRARARPAGAGGGEVA